MENLVVVAGGTGNLGMRLVKSLLRRRALVKTLVKRGTDNNKIQSLINLGAEVIEINFDNAQELQQSCANATCVVSTLQGLEDVIVGLQSKLLQAAINAGVPRFIPSDFSLDFTKIPSDRNRNFDLRRNFHKILDKSPITATSIFNSGFTELLTGVAPIILYKFKRILYWDNPDQILEFTTMDNTAEFTAAVALDPQSQRYFHIAGDRVTARDLVAIMTELSSEQYRLFYAGNISRLDKLISFTRFIMPSKNKLMPPWQGMQYMRDMFIGDGIVYPLDNNHYQDIRWQTIREVVSDYIQKKS